MQIIFQLGASASVKIFMNFFSYDIDEYSLLKIICDNVE